MNRSALIREIRVVDERLIRHQAQFQVSYHRSIQAIKQLNPWWLVGAGLMLGVAAGRMGWRGISALMLSGYRVSGMLRMTDHYLVNLGDKACPDLTEPKQSKV